MTVGVVLDDVGLLGRVCDSGGRWWMVLQTVVSG